MTELYLVRHGETELNVKGVYYGSIDCCLNEKGKRQARELAKILKGISFDIVISSPMKRAYDTANIICELNKKELIKDNRLMELDFGEWEGMHYSEVEMKYQKLWEQWGSDWKNTAPPKGESFVAVYERVKQSIYEILDKYKNKRILIVSHHGCLRIIPCILMELNTDLYWSFVFEQGKYSHFIIDNEHCIIKKINCGR